MMELEEKKCNNKIYMTEVFEFKPEYTELLIYM